MKGQNQSDRSHNVKSTKVNIARTVQNMEAASELISKTEKDRIRDELGQDNENREQALDGMQKQVKADAKHHKP
jgi:small acid-soluble spore protein tlp